MTGEMFNSRTFERWSEEFITELAQYINVSEEEARIYVGEIGDNGLREFYNMNLTPLEAVIDEVECWNETFDKDERIRLH